MVFLFNHEINENISATKVSTISLCTCIDSCFCRDSRELFWTPLMSRVGPMIKGILLIKRREQ